MKTLKREDSNVLKVFRLGFKLGDGLISTCVIYIGLLFHCICACMWIGKCESKLMKWLCMNNNMPWTYCLTVLLNCIVHLLAIKTLSHKFPKLLLHSVAPINFSQIVVHLCGSKVNRILRTMKFYRNSIP